MLSCVGDNSFTICEEGLGVLQACQLENPQTLITHELFISRSYLNGHCELFQDNILVPCDINSNQCISSTNSSSSYSLQCEIICKNTHITVRTRNFYFHSNSLPVCNLTGMLLMSCMHATLYCLRESLLVILILVILAT